jgi:hypothetical protein
MNLFKTIWLSAAFWLSGPAILPAQSLPASNPRTDAIRLVREHNKSMAAAVLEASIAVGQNRDEHDAAIAQEWLGIATYFFNAREPDATETAFLEAAQLAIALGQKKGPTDDLFALFRNLGTFAETGLHDRAQALTYYRFAIQSAGGGAKISAEEVARVQRKVAKVERDEALSKRRGKK